MTWIAKVAASSAAALIASVASALVPLALSANCCLR